MIMNGVFIGGIKSYFIQGNQCFAFYSYINIRINRSFYYTSRAMNQQNTVCMYVLRGLELIYGPFAPMSNILPAEFMRQIQ